LTDHAELIIDAADIGASIDIDDHKGLVYQIIRVDNGKVVNDATVEGLFSDGVLVNGDFFKMGKQEDSVDVVKRLTQDRVRYFHGTGRKVKGSVMKTTEGEYKLDISIDNYAEQTSDRGRFGGLDYQRHYKFEGSVVLLTNPNIGSTYGSIIDGDSFFEKSIIDQASSFEKSYLGGNVRTLKGRVQLVYSKTGNNRYDIQIDANRVRTVSNIMRDGVRGEDMDFDTILDEYVYPVVGTSLIESKEWKVHSPRDGVVVLTPSTSPGFKDVRNHPSVQALVGDDIQKSTEEEPKMGSNEEDELSLRSFLLAVALFIPYLVYDQTRGTRNEILQNMIGRIKRVRDAHMESVKTMIEKRRGYAGLDVNELLPDPPRPPASRPSASPARRRPPRTERSPSMVDAVIDEFVKTRMGRA